MTPQRIKEIVDQLRIFAREIDSSRQSAHLGMILASASGHIHSAKVGLEYSLTYFPTEGEEK